MIEFMRTNHAPASGKGAPTCIPGTCSPHSTHCQRSRARHSRSGDTSGHRSILPKGDIGRNKVGQGAATDWQPASRARRKRPPACYCSCFAEGAGAGAEAEAEAGTEAAAGAAAEAGAGAAAAVGAAAGALSGMQSTGSCVMRMRQQYDRCEKEEDAHVLSCGGESVRQGCGS